MNPSSPSTPHCPARLRISQTLSEQQYRSGFGKCIMISASIHCNQGLDFVTFDRRIANVGTSADSAMLVPARRRAPEGVQTIRFAAD